MSDPKSRTKARHLAQQNLDDARGMADDLEGLFRRLYGPETFDEMLAQTRLRGGTRRSLLADLYELELHVPEAGDTPLDREALAEADKRALRRAYAEGSSEVSSADMEGAGLV